MKTVTAACKTALKSKSRYILPKIKIYFSGSTVTLGQGDIISFNTDWFTYDESTPWPNAVMPGMLTLQIDNMSGNYSAGNSAGTYYGKMVKNVKVEVYASVQLADSSFEDVLIGTYYSAEWVPNETGEVVTLTAFDRLYQLFSKPMCLLPVSYSITATSAFTKIFTALGYTASDYSIDSALDSITIPTFYVKATKLSELFDDLCEGTLSMVYCDNTGKFIVKSIFTIGASADTLSDNDLIVSTNIKQRTNQVYSGAQFNRSIITQDTTEYLLVSQKSFSMAATPMTLSGIDLGDSPVYDITSVNLNGNSNLILTDLQYSTRQASITFTSSATPPVTVKMSIYGMILTVTQVQDKYFNATAQTAMGDVVYTFDSLYLQDVAFITGKKDAVTKLLSDSKSFVYITNRGIPYLDIYDCITITNPSQDLASVDVAPVVIKYNYDGVLSSTIIGLNKASIT